MPNDARNGTRICEKGHFTIIAHTDTRHIYDIYHYLYIILVCKIIIVIKVFDEQVLGSGLVIVVLHLTANSTL
jgi:hypothetical protein